LLLAADIGNTQTVLGLYQARELQKQWRLATVPDTTANELILTLLDLFNLDGVEKTAVLGLVVASVVPQLTECYRKLGRLLGDVPVLLVNGNTRHGLNIDYANPNEIGADRIASAIAAIEFYGYPVAVVDFGTATNIEVIDKRGQFIGGIIAPGLQTSATALFSACARLARVDLKVPPAVIGRSTTEAIQAGLTYGEIDRVDGLVERVFAQLGYKMPVVATGGLSRRVASLSRTITTINDELTLAGLQLIWERQQGKVQQGKVQQDRVQQGKANRDKA
jgi:type III pantothenate kinase